MLMWMIAPDEKLRTALEREGHKIGFIFGELLGVGGMSDGVYLALDKKNDFAAVKIITASKFPFLNNYEAESVLPADKIVPVYVSYSPADNAESEPASIEILNEDTEDLARCGDQVDYDFDKDPELFETDWHLEFMLQRIVSGRDYPLILKEAEEERGRKKSLIVGFKSYQFFTFNGHLHHAYEMEQMDWPTLQDIYDKGLTIPEKGKHQIAAQLCDLLELLEATRICHRDLKPGNIFVNPETYDIEIGDWDLAFSLEGRFHKSSSKDVGPLIKKTSLTKGRVFGTPLYMAPEIVRSGTNEDSIELNIYTDTFSVGIILMQLYGGLDKNRKRWQIYDEQEFALMMERLNKNNVIEPVRYVIREMLHDLPIRRNYRTAQDLFPILAEGEVLSLLENTILSESNAFFSPSILDTRAFTMPARRKKMPTRIETTPDDVRSHQTEIEFGGYTASSTGIY